MKITLSACNMLQSIWRHSGNNSMPGESFLFPGRSSNTNALTAAQHSPARCQRVGPLGAPCGSTHKWGRRNGPLASLGGSLRFSRSLLSKSVSDRHFHICKLHRTSFVHFLFGSSCLPQSLAVGISAHILFMWCVPYEFAPKPGPR